MKKVLLSLLAVAALVLSCQNYDDEFDALNSKIASLESQIQSLADLKTAVTGVQSSVSALQAAVSAAQTAANAAAAAAADAAAEAEAASAASADAAAAAAAAAAANAAAIADLASNIADIAADLVDLDTAIAGASTPADLAALKTELNTTLAALNALIEANAEEIADILLNNASLAASLAALGIDVDLILDTVYTYEGNLTINDIASLAFAQNLGGKVKAIKGDVVIDVNSSNYTDISLAEVNAVTKQIMNVNGNVSVNGYNASVDLSGLKNITGDYIVTGYDALDDNLETVGDDVYFNYDGAYTSNLKVADNIFLYANSATTVAPIKTGTTSIEFMSLIKATGLQTVDASGVTAHSSGGSAHTSGGAVTASGTIGGAGATATNALNLTAATTSVKIAQAPVKYVYGTKLATLELHYASAGTASSAALDFLTINGAALTSATVKAKKVTGTVSVTAKATGSSFTMDDAAALTTVSSNAVTNSFAALAQVGDLTLSGATSPSLPALTKATGAITAAAATSISLPVLATATSITAGLVTGTVSLPALTSGTAMSFAKETAFDAKKATVISVDLDATKAIVIDLGNIALTGNGTTQFPDLAKITKLNLHAQTKSIASATLSGAALMTDLTIIGKATSTLDSSGRANIDVVLDGTSGFAKLANVTTIGVHDVVSVSNMAKLTSMTTGGTIYVFVFDNNDLVVDGLTFGHTEDADLGSYTSITNNALLKGFTTTFNKPHYFNVSANPKLEKFDASSFTSLPNWLDEQGINAALYTLGSISFIVNGNYAGATYATATGMKGSYVGDTASTDESFGEDSINSLKPILTALYNGAYVGSSPIYSAWVTAGSGKTTTVTLNYISAPTALEVTSTAQTAGASVVRSITWADGEMADVTAE